MRILLILFAAATSIAQGPRVLFSNTTENLRGVSAVSQKVAWASGTHGTYLRTTDGNLWVAEQVPGAESLDFRGLAAFSADEAFLMSAGPGDQSRIYHTVDAGRHWQLQFTNSNPKGFFDSMVFWDKTHGIVLGDPIPDESGSLKFELLMTDDGQTWTPLPSSQLQPAIEGEGAFAASNTCLAILPNRLVIPSEARDPGLPKPTPSAQVRQPAAIDIPVTAEPSASQQKHSWKNGALAPDPNIWFATGGKAARVFHSPDLGRTWQIFDTPITHGPDSAGIFSISFLDSAHGVIAGGDYKHPEQDGPNLAFTNDGGKTWTLSTIRPQAYFSAAAYDRHTMTPPGKKKLDENQVNARLFIVGPEFVFDFRPPANPRRIGSGRKQKLQFNAVSPYPGGGALAVGPKGSMAMIP